MAENEFEQTWKNMNLDKWKYYTQDMKDRQCFGEARMDSEREFEEPMEYLLYE